MQIKNIREKTHLTQKEFAEQYHIPLQTLKQWESSTNSSSHRQPPPYVLFLLDRLVSQEQYDPRKDKTVRWFINGAEKSKTSSKQWLRYLRKTVTADGSKLLPEQIRAIRDSERLSLFQKVVLSQAMDKNTLTHKCIAALNGSASRKMIKEVMRKHGYSIA